MLEVGIAIGSRQDGYLWSRYRFRTRYRSRRLRYVGIRIPSLNRNGILTSAIEGNKAGTVTGPALRLMIPFRFVSG